MKPSWLKSARTVAAPNLSPLARLDSIGSYMRVTARMSFGDSTVGAGMNPASLKLLKPALTIG